MNEKQVRMQKANELISCISGCGRKFFFHNGKPSAFVFDSRQRVWFVDAYENKYIYTHYTMGRWRGFSEGGTLRDLVIRLRDYITKGETIGRALGPYPDWYSDGDPWGYGKDMKKVYNKALELGIVV